MRDNVARCCCTKMTNPSKMSNPLLFAEFAAFICIKVENRSIPLGLLAPDGRLDLESIVDTRYTRVF